MKIQFLFKSLQWVQLAITFFNNILNSGPALMHFLTNSWQTSLSNPGPPEAHWPAPDVSAFAHLDCWLYQYSCRALLNRGEFSCMFMSKHTVCPVWSFHVGWVNASDSVLRGFRKEWKVLLTARSRRLKDFLRNSTIARFYYSCKNVCGFIFTKCRTYELPQ